MNWHLFNGTSLVGFKFSILQVLNPAVLSNERLVLGLEKQRWVSSCI